MSFRRKSVSRKSRKSPRKKSRSRRTRKYSVRRSSRRVSRKNVRKSPVRKSRKPKSRYSSRRKYSRKVSIRRRKSPVRRNVCMANRNVCMVNSMANRNVCMADRNIYTRRNLCPAYDDSSNEYMIFTLENCGGCIALKSLLAKSNIVIDEKPLPDCQDEYNKLIGNEKVDRYVPMIYKKSTGERINNEQFTKDIESGRIKSNM